ncbi:hypothetical protein F5Y11DRAFT_186785 [Daldinia sp. FL1419]|nr:hypothetical protein F5Y11DRAFT_186785 [Daldinia sp. FL1419]
MLLLLFFSLFLPVVVRYLVLHTGRSLFDALLAQSSTFIFFLVSFQCSFRFHFRLLSHLFFVFGLFVFFNFPKKSSYVNRAGKPSISGWKLEPGKSESTGAYTD